MIHGLVFGGMTLKKVQEIDYDINGNLFALDEQDYSLGALIETVSAKRSSGGHRIASYLRRHGMDVEMIDFTYAWTVEELKDLWKSRYNSNTLFLGVSVVFGFRFRNFWLFVEWVREKYPHIHIVGGSQSLDKILPLKLDWYVFGYGEKAILELLTNLKEGTNSKIKYYTFPGGKKVINAQKDYKAYGPGMRDLSVSYEDRDFIGSQELLDLEFSRGCIFRCAFCTYPILGVRDDHSRDEKNLDRELRENFDRFGITRYTVTDETTNDYTEKLERYASVTRNLPFKINMGGYIRGDLLAARKKDWPLFVDLGYMNMFYGIESMHHPSAKAIHKGMDSGKLQDGLLEFKEYAYKNHGFFNGMISLIAGLPHETFASMDKTVEWLLKNWSDQTSHVYPLHMSNVNIPEDYQHLIAPFDSSSKMEKDPAGYGYEILTPEKLKEEVIKKEVEEMDGLMDKMGYRFKRQKEGEWLNDDLLKGPDIGSKLKTQINKDNNEIQETKGLKTLMKAATHQYQGYMDTAFKEKDKDLYSEVPFTETNKPDPVEYVSNPNAFRSNGAIKEAENKKIRRKKDARWIRTDVAKFDIEKFKKELGNNKGKGTKELVDNYSQHIPFRMELNEMIWKSNTGLTMVDWLKYMDKLHLRFPIKSMPNITSGGVPVWNFAEFLIDPSVPYESMMEPRSTQVDTIEGVTFASANNVFARTGIFKTHFINEYKRKKLNA